MCAHRVCLNALRACVRVRARIAPRRREIRAPLAGSLRLSSAPPPPLPSLPRLRTLERYGSTCKHWAAARCATDIPEAPTFHPTEEEFEDYGAYVRSLLPKISRYGICKVVPPAGWKPRPWSGAPPPGASSSAVVTPGGGWHGDSAVEAACHGLSGSADAAGGDVAAAEIKVSPRVQMLSLFNKSFEQYADTLTLRQYRDLADAVWPACATPAAAQQAGAPPVCVGEAEAQFWDLMAGSAPKGFAMYKTKLRIEARAYQAHVQRMQPLPPGGQAAAVHAPGPRNLLARVLPELPWELQGAEPVLARPAAPPPPRHDAAPPPLRAEASSDEPAPAEAARAGEAAEEADGQRSKRAWTPEDDEAVLESRRVGATFSEIADYLDRTMAAVKARYHQVLRPRAGGGGEGGEGSGESGGEGGGEGVGEAAAAAMAMTAAEPAVSRPWRRSRLHR